MKKTLIILFLWICLLTMSARIFAQEAASTDSEEIISKVIGGFTNQDNTYIDLLINHPPEDKTRRGMILHFCDVVLDVYKDGKLAQPSFSYGNMSYDPKKSLFVYALCVNMDKAPEHSSYKDAFKPTDGFDIQKLIKQDITDLNDIRNIPSQDTLDGGSSYHGCNPKTSMGDCNFTNFLPDIYSTIMNDLSNLKLASIYGYKYDHNKKEDREKAIADFAHTFFHDPEHPEIACNDKATHYINKEQLSDGKSEHCSHPKTYQYLDEMIKSAWAVVKKTAYLDGKSIMESACEDPNKNPLLCAMSSTGFTFVAWSRNSFQNVLLNEQMFYNLFLWYYQGLIDQSINYEALNFKRIGSNTERETFESSTISQEQAFAQQGMYQMLRQLENLYATFPIHIGLLSYYEDLVYFRKRITTLYTPLHQLYYEFRNAQDCSK